MTFRSRLKYDDRPLLFMTRYSASRGILYSAPPGSSGNRTESGEDAGDATPERTETDESTAETVADTGGVADAAADD
jgi:hypothetical protein